MGERSRRDLTRGSLPIERQDLQRLAVEVEGLLPDRLGALLEVLVSLLRGHPFQALIAGVDLQPPGGAGQGLLVGARRAPRVNLAVVAVGVPGGAQGEAAAYHAVGLVSSLAKARHRRPPPPPRLRATGSGSGGW